ncbi:potassium channel family protein [Actinocorallia aurea]
MSGNGREQRRQAWERKMEWPLLAAALAFLFSYAIPILLPGVSPGVRRAAEVLFLLVWALFALDYAVRLVLARDRWKFVRGSLFDLALVVLPLFRPLRMLRLVVVFNVINRRAQMTLRGQVLTYVVGSAVLVVFLASLAILDAERANPDANIRGLGDALWWSLTTISTVGYGDRYPTTADGRITAALLMLAGIALIGVITASLASWFIEHLQDVQREEERTNTALTEVLAELRLLHDRLDRLEQGTATGPAHDGPPPALPGTADHLDPVASANGGALPDP